MELTAGEAWSRILESARATLPEQSFETWLAPTSAVGLTEDELVVGAPSAFAVEWIQGKYGPLLDSVAHSLFGDTFRLTFETGVGGVELGSVSAARLSEVPVDGAPVEPAQPDPEGPAGPVIGGLNSRYTLARFVVSRNNHLAAAAARGVAEAPGRAYNPLFIHGGVGLGKTHLMQAIGHAALKARPDARVGYVSCETFMNELIDAIQSRQTARFRSRYRNIDVLLVDDVHFLGDKEATQEEFFHTFNALHEGQKQIVLTSDRPPTEIQKLGERLSSRFEWGLVCDIKPPDFETRLAILRMKADGDGLNIDDEVLSVIAARCDSSVRALEGALIKLLAFSSLTQRDLDGAYAEEILQAPAPTRSVSPDDIRAAVAREFKVPLKQLDSRTRAREVVLARQVCMYLLKEILELPHTRIGRLLGGRDHSTVIHALKKIEKKLAAEPDFAAQVKSLRAVLNGRRR